MKITKLIYDIRDEAKEYLNDMSTHDFTIAAIDILKMDIKLDDYGCYNIGQYIELSMSQFENDYRPFIINHLNRIAAIKVFKRKIGNTIYFQMVEGNPDYYEYELG